MSTKEKTGSNNDSSDDTSFKYYPKNFQPRDTDVIVGKGLNCYHHVGNKMLRGIIASRLEEYGASTRKKEKSLILQSVMEQVRKVGEFVQKDFETGLWYNADNFLARDKVSQTFRNILSENEGKRRTNKRKQRREIDEGNNKSASLNTNKESSEYGNYNVTSSKNHLKGKTQNERVRSKSECFESNIFLNPDKEKADKLDDEGDSLESIDYAQSFLQENHWSNNYSFLRPIIQATDFVDFLKRYESSLTDGCFEDPNPYEPKPLPDVAAMEDTNDDIAKRHSI